jgi:hypothetical protein
MKIMKIFPEFLISLLLILLTGCVLSEERSELEIQVDKLIENNNAEWITASTGNFYYQMVTGRDIMVTPAGKIYLVIYPKDDKAAYITVTDNNIRRSAKLSKRFGANKLSREAIDNSWELQAELMKEATIFASNKINSFIQFENPEKEK